MSASPALHPTLERILRDFEQTGRAADARASLTHAARARAAQRLTQLGWPSSRDEQWRYTNLRAYDQVATFQPAVPPSATATELPPPLPNVQRLVFFDGVRERGAERPALPAAATWTAEQRLGLLADMFATDAAVLSVTGEMAVEVLFINSAGVAAYPRLAVTLEPDARLQLIERHLGGSAGSLVCANVQLNLARGSQLTHTRLQQCAADVTFSDSLSAELAEAAQYRARHLSFGAGSARSSAQVRLNGRGAEVDWQAIAVGRGQQVHDGALRVDHLAPDTRTTKMFRGIADERSRVAFSSHVQIESAGVRSQAHQSLRGLIEGVGAEIDLRPRLEINTDEVQAQHGATTGRLDETLLFYLLSRGIDPATARALLKWAFLGDVLRAIELAPLRAEAERAAAGQLRDAIDLGGAS